MKRLLLLTFLFFFAKTVLFAQVPQGIPYQAAARGANGQPLANSNVNVRFSIIDSTTTGATVYQETHATTTNNVGLFSLNLGLGTPVIGTFSNINWGKNNKFLKVEIDSSGTGSNYLDMGTQQMLSVPYALYAGTALNTSSSVASHLSSNIIASSRSQLNYTFAEAINYCASLTEGGYTDWRIPTLDDVINWISINGIPTTDMSTWTCTPTHTMTGTGAPEFYTFYINGSSSEVGKVGATSQNYNFAYGSYNVHLSVFCVR